MHKIIRKINQKSKSQIFSFYLDFIQLIVQRFSLVILTYDRCPQQLIAIFADGFLTSSSYLTLFDVQQ